MSRPSTEAGRPEGEHDDAPDGRLPLRIHATGYVRVDVPAGLPPGPAPAVVAVHGYGQPPEVMRTYARAVAPAHAIVVAPEGPTAFYRNPRAVGGAAAGGVRYGWIADPDRAAAEARNSELIAAALDAAHARHPIDPDRTLLLAFSQGVGVALHFLLEHPHRAVGVAALAGGLREGLRTRLVRLAGRPVLWLSGAHDHAYPPRYTAPLVEALRAAGVDLDARVLDAGHDLLDPARSILKAWLAARGSGPSTSP